MLGDNGGCGGPCELIVGDPGPTPPADASGTGSDITALWEDRSPHRSGGPPGTHTSCGRRAAPGSQQRLGGRWKWTGSSRCRSGAKGSGGLAWLRRSSWKGRVCGPGTGRDLSPVWICAPPRPSHRWHQAGAPRSSLSLPARPARRTGCWCLKQSLRPRAWDLLIGRDAPAPHWGEGSGDTPPPGEPRRPPGGSAASQSESGPATLASRGSSTSDRNVVGSHVLRAGVVPVHCRYEPCTRGGHPTRRPGHILWVLVGVDPVAPDAWCHCMRSL